MKAVWNDTVVAEAPQDELVRIEGNWYFPQESIKKEHFEPTDHSTECFWKGTANYYTLRVNDQTLDNGAWYYAKPMDGSIDRVGKDFTNFVAFYPQVTVSE